MGLVCDRSLDEVTSCVHDERITNRGQAISRPVQTGTAARIPTTAAHAAAIAQSLSLGNTFAEKQQLHLINENASVFL